MPAVHRLRWSWTCRSRDVIARSATMAARSLARSARAHVPARLPSPRVDRRMPGRTATPSRCVELFPVLRAASRRHRSFSRLPGRASWPRFTRVIRHSRGVIEGTSLPHAGHAVAYEHGHIFDPGRPWNTTTRLKPASGGPSSRSTSGAWTRSEADAWREHRAKQRIVSRRGLPGTPPPARP